MDGDERLRHHQPTEKGRMGLVKKRPVMGWPGSAQRLICWACGWRRYAKAQGACDAHISEDAGNHHHDRDRPRQEHIPLGWLDRRERSLCSQTTYHAVCSSSQPSFRRPMADADNPPWIKALAEVRRLAPREGWRYQHVQAIIVSIDQYAEAALGNREFFLNKPYGIGGGMKDNIP
jgi:hypothetical protein